MPFKTADVCLTNAEEFYANGNTSAAEAEILEAVQILSTNGSEIVESLSSAEFETPIFAVARRITTVFLPDTTEISLLFNDLPLPKTTAPKDIVTSVQRLYLTEPETEAPEKDTSRIELLLAYLTGQQTMRDTIFGEDGLYQTVTGAASPYLAGFLAYTGDDTDSAAEKTDDIFYGPIRRLAELFYSLLTSSLAAGLLLLLIRRMVPVFRPSKAATVVNAAVLTAANIPVIIEGLRAVAKELDELRRIVKG